MISSMREVFIAEDGTVFLNKDECFEYECKITKSMVDNHAYLKLVESNDRYDDYHIYIFDEEGIDAVKKYMTAELDMLRSLHEGTVSPVSPDPVLEPGVWYSYMIYHPYHHGAVVTVVRPLRELIDQHIQRLNNMLTSYTLDRATPVDSNNSDEIPTIHTYDNENLINLLIAYDNEVFSETTEREDCKDSDEQY